MTNLFDDAVKVMAELEKNNLAPKVFIVSSKLMRQCPETVEQARRAMENWFGRPVKLVVYPSLPKGTTFYIETKPKEVQG